MLTITLELKRRLPAIHESHSDSDDLLLRQRQPEHWRGMDRAIPSWVFGEVLKGAATASHLHLVKTT